MRSFIQRRDGPFQQGVRVVMLLAILMFQLGPAYVRANPQGEQVAAGSASFERAGSTLTIHTSDRVIINWRDFSIQSGELTKFVQPSVHSAALNRVVSGNPSSIFGTLQANGRIFLINPNGVLVGSGARIDTGGFIASTLDVADGEFLSGGEMNFLGNSAASIENQGAINVIGGDVFLIAREVSNSGQINAPDGVVGLAAGHDVLLTQAGQQRVFIRPTAPAGPASGHGISNSGALAAARVELQAHGNLYALAINNTGVVRANGAQVGGDGRVFLTANGGAVTVGGTIEARGSGDAGGHVTVAAERVDVSSATIDVSGETGGGSVKIGGGYQGRDATVVNSMHTAVSADSVIKADATVQGDGGEVVVWSDGTTDFDGIVLARGAGAGGNGGFAEVSGKEMLNYRGHVDLRAESGKTGMLLLDPKNIAVTPAGTDPVAGNSLFTDNPAGWSLISGADLSAAIDTASVTLQANTDIFINDDVTGATLGNGLTLQAGRSITIEQDAVVSLNGGDFSATINDDAAELANRDAGLAVFSMENNAQVLTGGGNFTVSHGNLDGTGEGEVRLGTGTANDGAATISAGAGDVDITGTGSASGTGNGIAMGNGSTVETTTGAIAMSGTGDGVSAGIAVSGGSNAIGGPGTSGDITLAAETTAGSDSISLANLTVQSSGELFLMPLVSATGIGLAGGAGDFNLSTAELDLFANGFSKVTVGRSDGTGTINFDTYTFSDSIALQSALSAGDGAISVTGALATSGLDDTIELYAGKNVTVSGGSLTTNDGDITITGNVNGTYAAWTMGVDFNSSASVSSGDGNILILGKGGDSAPDDWAIGVRIQGSSLQSTGGDIDIQGEGGAGASHTPGILVEWGGGQVTTVSGNITLTGDGGASSGTENWGVSVSDGGAVSASGSGGVTVTGTGGGGTDLNYGVKITGSGSVSVDSGDMLITGLVNSPSGQWNHGVDIDSGGQVLSDNGGKISIFGTGGDGTLENHGIRIADNGTLVQSSTGDILMNGLGGAGSQEGNRGMVIEGGADIRSTGSALVTLDGAGGAGAWGNHGVIIAGGGTTVTSVDGDIAISGLGADAGGGWNNGVWIFAAAEVEATGAAKVLISGLAGNGGANGDNWGVMIEGAGTRIAAVDGDLALSGIGKGTTDQNNVGLYMRDGIEVASTGAGAILLSGSGSDSAAGIVVSGVGNVVGGPSATGAMTLTAHTASGADSIDLSGVSFQSSGPLTLQPLAAGTSIGLAGEAGTFNLSSAELDLFQNGFSSITIGLPTGTGTANVGAYTFNEPLTIQSAAAGGGGVININGALATSTAGDSIDLVAGRGVVINDDITTNDGDVTILGNQTGTATGFSFGVDLISSTISTGAGNISIVGNAGDDLGSNFGIGARLTTGARLETTSGNITLDGMGNPSGDSFNWGVLLEWASTTVQTDSGDINITGTGGGTGSDNVGVLIQGTSVVQSNSGAIDIVGTGSAGGTTGNHGVKIDFSDVSGGDGPITLSGNGEGTTNDNYGILVTNGATITSSGAATIDLDGTGGAGTWWNVGTYIIGGGTIISSASGDITIGGTGGNGNASENFGVLVAGGALVQSTSTAQIDITGTGGDGTWGNHGVALFDPGTTVTTVDGDITMIGTGGAGSQGWNVGLRLQNGSLVESTGLGEINLTGNGTAGVEDNWGYWMNGATVISSNADIEVTGTGAGTSQTNYGIFLENGATIDNLGSGNVTLTGTGGDADWGNHGVLLTGAGTEVCVEDGNLLILGYGGNGVGGWNTGVRIDDFAMVEACNNGSVTIQGIGGSGTDDNWGIQANNGSVTSIIGDITITGLGGGLGLDNYGIYLEAGTSILSFDSARITLDGRGAGAAEGIKTATGDNDIGGVLDTGTITLIASTAAGTDSIDLSGATVTGIGGLVMRPLNGATTIGLGGGSGVFNLSGAELAMLQDGFTQITIGLTGGTGAVDIGAATFQDPVSIYGGATTLTGPLDAGSNDVLVKARGSLTLAGSVTGGNVRFVTSTKFINLAGANPITLNGGRFLIYSVLPSQNKLGGLAYNFQQFGVTFPAPPSHQGNGLLYSGSDPLMDWAMNVLLPEFVNTDDRSQHYQTDHQHFAWYDPGGNSIGYGPGGPVDPSFQDALAQFSSFDLPEPKKVGEEGL